VVGYAELGIEPTFIHAVYLINLASADPLIARRSRDSLTAALEAGAALRVSGVVTHLGSHGGRGYFESPMRQPARSPRLCRGRVYRHRRVPSATFAACTHRGSMDTRNS
jgi:sugar phosphate isomerase/epimerase